MIFKLSNSFLLYLYIENIDLTFYILKGVKPNY